MKIILEGNVLHVQGEVELYSSVEFRLAILQAIENINANTRLILDFSKLRFIDSTGLGVLLSLREIHNFKIINITNGNVERVFRLLKLKEILDIE